MAIIYSKTKLEFTQDITSGKLMNSFTTNVGNMFAQNQMRAIRNSMNYMERVIRDPSIPDDAGIAIEYKIPASAKRIDFLISGKDENKEPVVVLIELKQWESAKLTDKDAMVETFVGGAVRETLHPSYQAWSYTTIIKDYNESIRKNNIGLQPCAYLHNYKSDNVITNEFYDFYLKQAPVFFETDAEKLQKFIKKFVKFGDNKKTLYLIENGKIRPSKDLADYLSSMLAKNAKEFTLIDEQKIVYEKALQLARESTDLKKNVFIVEGGPGTGKSVVAIHLLSRLTSMGLNTRYVTKNAAPRQVYAAKLSGTLVPGRIRNLFSSSGVFFNADKNSFDALIVDEAHRLNKYSGIYGNQGENQIKELMQTGKFTIFFIDDDQRVTIKDIGKKETIIKIAKDLNIPIHEDILPSQFRCNGSDGYLAWVNHILQIRESANEKLSEIDYDFKVFDSPDKLHSEIKRLNEKNNKSRLVAGYCWNWVSKRYPEKYDITIGDYQAKWNLKNHGSRYIINPKSVTEVGCIHTVQGLELDYVGVIIGPDLVVRNGKIITDATKRATTDQSFRGVTNRLRDGDPEILKSADEIIKNTYRVLMTRGAKGCYIYCTDAETQEYFKKNLQHH